MANTLIGYTGFVGGVLSLQPGFDDLFRSTNIGEIAGREYDLLVCAGAPAAKWKANQRPEEDLANLRTLMASLSAARAKNAVLISTVDVYPDPQCVYEDAVIDPALGNAYGRHRLLLEQFFAEHFASSYIVRLPGLFGRGLKKNFIFDLVRNPASLSMTHCDSVFQFYNIERIWNDIQALIVSGVRLCNLATPPVSAKRVASDCFGFSFDNITDAGPVRYDIRTHHASVFGRSGDYISSLDEILRQIADFATGEKATPGA
jgi:hypothetical protein